jgi:hypothetical protein
MTSVDDIFTPNPLYNNLCPTTNPHSTLQQAAALAKSQHSNSQHSDHTNSQFFSQQRDILPECQQENLLIPKSLRTLFCVDKITLSTLQ